MTANRELRTANREPRTANRQPRTANRQPRTANCEPRTANLIHSHTTTFQIISYICSQRNGLVAEWLGRGLQNLVQRFESARDLKECAKRDCLKSQISPFSSVLQRVNPKKDIAPTGKSVGSGNSLNRRIHPSEGKLAGTDGFTRRTNINKEAAHTFETASCQQN